MASTRRVTVSASRTRPSPQTRCSPPPCRASEMDSFTIAEMPELSICGISFKLTITLRAPPATSFCMNALRCSLGSPMVSRPCTSTKWMPSAAREEISSGGCRVIEVFLTSILSELPGGREASGCRRQLHYTMIRMKDKPIGVVHKHRWDVDPAEARKIQEELRGHWKSKDSLGAIRTVAGLDASFVLTGSQALKKPVNRWNRLREANRAIGCVVMYRFPEMEEVERAFAIL